MLDATHEKFSPKHVSLPDSQTIKYSTTLLDCGVMSVCSLNYSRILNTTYNSCNEVASTATLLYRAHQTVCTFVKRSPKRAVSIIMGYKTRWAGSGRHSSGCGRFLSCGIRLAELWEYFAHHGTIRGPVSRLAKKTDRLLIQLCVIRKCFIVTNFIFCQQSLNQSQIERCQLYCKSINLPGLTKFGVEETAQNVNVWNRTKSIIFDILENMQSLQDSGLIQLKCWISGKEWTGNPFFKASIQGITRSQSVQPLSKSPVVKTVLNPELRRMSRFMTSSHSLNRERLNFTLFML